MSVPIEQYAMIGDCDTAALVSHRGSIDWLCWPHFASPACFAALVGTEENGCWSIAPKNPVPGRRRYLDQRFSPLARSSGSDSSLYLRQLL